MAKLFYNFTRLWNLSHRPAEVPPGNTWVSPQRKFPNLRTLVRSDLRGPESAWGFSDTWWRTNWQRRSRAALHQPHQEGTFQATTCLGNRGPSCIVCKEALNGDQGSSTTGRARSSAGAALCGRSSHTVFSGFSFYLKALPCLRFWG